MLNIKKMAPPVAEQRHHTIEKHGKRWDDPWFWMREKQAPDVTAYLNAENAYTKEVLAPTGPLQDTLYAEIKGRIKEKDRSVPQKDGEYWYYRRYETGGEYPVYCRTHGEAGEENVLLDMNAEASTKKFLDLGVFEVSPDGRYLAYSFDEDGSEKFTIHVKDLKTGEKLDEEIPNTHSSLAWSKNSDSFFYTVLDAHLRPQKVYWHRLHSDVPDDPVVYEEPDPGFFVGVHKGLSGEVIYIHSQGSHVSEARFLLAGDPLAKPRLIAARADGIEYSVCDRNGEFFIRTNEGGAKDFKVVRAPMATPSKEHWRDFVPHAAGSLVKSVEVFSDYCVVELLKNGLAQIWVHDFRKNTAHFVSFEAPVYDVETGGYREFGSSQLRFVYSSLNTPDSVYDYDMSSAKRVLKKQTEIPSGFDPGAYVVKREWAIAPDGVKVPISLLYKKDTPLDGSAPLYLYGYGSYGLSRMPDFSVARLSLVDRGYVFALAHIRGGMELGWDWYESAKLLRKRTTFSDFIACAEHLIQSKFSSKGNVVACGGSAGGMLMGVVANERPEIFKAIVAHVPFVDVLNTMLDASLPLTPIEYKEWGNPENREYFEYISSYSPYDNVKAQAYPHFFITGGLNDPRVTYWEPTKWAAKLRATKTDDNILLLKIHKGFGHAGASGRFEYIKEVAEEYAFILSLD
ncbi:MAG: S9 family peptidase [Bdellovibrionales bacterium]|nr:S9 family peptidase [Bdellovibrionales bacterium]